MQVVSILIPAYNAEAWIADTIRSAMAQTWDDKEIIVVDDGSTDRTLAIAQQFESHSVLVLGQKNQGASAARNKAFSVSRGSYIQWLDADDLLAPDKIARQMELVTSGVSPRTVLSGAWAHFSYHPHRARFSPTALWCDMVPEEFLLRKLEGKVFMQTAVWLVSRELIQAAGPWDVTISHDDDGEYFCRVLLASEGIRFVPDSKVYYRAVGSTSLSQVGASNKKLESLWRSMQLHIGYLRSAADSERTRAACLRYLQNYLITFYPLRMDIVDQMKSVSLELGGKLAAPQLSWKYSWIKALLGWEAARQVEVSLRRFKWSLVRHFDQAMGLIETRTLASKMRT